MKKLPMISVTTLPNGYALKFDGAGQPSGYMYFTPEKLLEGFMLHIGLHMTDQLNPETMQEFIVTAMNWNDNKSCVKEIERLETEVRRVKGRHGSIAKKLVRERNSRILLANEVSELSRKYKYMPELVKEIKGILRVHSSITHFTLKGLGIDSSYVIEDDDNENDD